MMLFQYPDAARFGRTVPKTKIYEHAQPSTALKNAFVRQVDSITWQAKLAPETVNLPATALVREIQVFVITLKTGELNTDVLRAIDEAIPFPLLYELHYDGAIQLWAAYKTPQIGQPARSSTGAYHWSPWLSQHDPRRPLPVVLDMEQLYGQLLAPLLPHPARPGERLPQHMARLTAIGQAQRELAATERRLRGEKQYNRRLAIHTTLRQQQQVLQQLLAPTRPQGAFDAEALDAES